MSEDIEARRLKLRNCLQHYSDRKFKDYPPKPDETLAELGLGAEVLEEFVRWYVNRHFKPVPKPGEKPKKGPLYGPNKLTPDIKYKDLCDKCSCPLPVAA